MRIIRNIAVCLLPIFCVLALFLKLNGIDHIDFNDDYYCFMLNVLQNSSIFKFEIPQIPEIPQIGNNFLDFVIGFLNGLSAVINILSSIVNVLIKLVTFLLGLLKTIIDGIEQIFLGRVVLN